MALTRFTRALAYLAGLAFIRCTPPQTATHPAPPVATQAPAEERQPCDAARRLATEDSRLPTLCQSITYVGFKKLEEAGLVPKGKDPRVAVAEGVPGRDELAGTWHVYQYDAFFFALHEQTPVAFDMLLFTVGAMDTIKTKLPTAYAFVKSTTVAPAEAPLSCCTWKNRFTTITVLFDTTPAEIAASATVLGASIQQDGVGVWENAALISIDRETVLGNDKDHGSRAIYRMERARDNFIAYFKDGIIYTMLHEMAHRYIDQRNSTSELSNVLWNARNVGRANVLLKSLPGGVTAYFNGDSPTSELQAALRDNEEVIANETAFVLSKPVLSEKMANEHAAQNKQWSQGPQKLGLVSATAALDKGNAKDLQLPLFPQ